MTTSAEFIKGGITGQTFREVIEKFGRPFNRLAEEDEVMWNYALGFAWFREREHLPVPEAHSKVMSLSINGIEALFEDKTPEVQALVDFGSQPPTTMP
jgi:hypothetical protein